MSIKATILRAEKKEFICKSEPGDELIAIAPRKIFKKNQLVAGDIVIVQKDEQGELFTILKLIKRKNEIFRLSIRERKKRVTAANCDLMIVTTSVNSPPYKQGVLDRLLVRATQWNIPAVVIFNKIDLFDNSFDLSFEIKRLKSFGVNSFTISAIDTKLPPINGGQSLSDLKDLLIGKMAILLGQSGVGKSKLISAISDKKIDLLSNKIGKSGKGSHTTTWSEIIQCGKFNLIDSPGVRSLSIDDIDKDELIKLFPDLAPIALKCKFNNCTHKTNIKGCAFQDLTVLSEMDSRIRLSRLDSFLKLKEEIDQINPWDRG